MKSEWRNETILVVEDTESIRRMVCTMLLQAGYHCVEAANGARALDLLQNRQHPIDLVLTDIIMPEMTGAELARRLARTEPDLRIVFMSGYTDDPLVRGIERTPSIFLAKPFTAAALMDKVREMLDRPWVGLQMANRSGFSAP